MMVMDMMTTQAAVQIKQDQAYEKQMQAISLVPLEPVDNGICVGDNTSSHLLWDVSPSQQVSTMSGQALGQLCSGCGS